MNYSLDTNTCIYVLNNRYPNVSKTLLSKKPVDIRIPSMVAAELRFGAEKSITPSKTRKCVETFLSPFQITPFGDAEAQHYAKTRAELENSGTPIGPNDLVIAATAMATGSVLVTRNTKEFSRVAGLQLEDWTE